MTDGLYFRLAYTFAHATDDGQDALVAGRPATVQNSYSTSSERGPSVTDQRHRLALSWIGEPQPFGREHNFLAKLFNDWKISGVVTVGSGRPVARASLAILTRMATLPMIACLAMVAMRSLVLTMLRLTYRLRDAFT
jgi:hypothetical protein